MTDRLSLTNALADAAIDRQKAERIATDIPPPSIQYLRECFEHVTGSETLIWRSRPPAHFPDERACKIWNTRYAESERQVGVEVPRGAGRSVLSIVFIWATEFSGHLETGAWPAGELDHVNGLLAGDRLSNLRPATRSENLANTPVRRNNRCRVKGVFWDIRRNKWCARIVAEGRQFHLGYFDNLINAKEAYIEAAVSHFGAFARP